MIPGLTIAFGVVLLVIGVACAAVTRFAAPTALIPAGIGLFEVIVGLLARDPARSKSTTIAAIVIAVIGAGGSMRGLKSWLAILRGEDVALPLAAFEQFALFALSLIYVIWIAVHVARHGKS